MSPLDQKAQLSFCFKTRDWLFQTLDRAFQKISQAFEDLTENWKLDRKLGKLARVFVL